MAPKRGESIERTDAHDDFLKKLVEYHAKRGTNFDPEPRVGVRHVDLWKLYNRVVDEGGYDMCSDTKAKPLMWRGFAEEFVGKNQYTAAQAFQIKNVYYKNLCAYEIATHWGKEPPPKEILEDVTAKGGNVMTRTSENYSRPPTKEEMNLGHGEGSDASPEQRTPKAEVVEAVEDPGSGTGRTSRGLRQAPPQRVLFQPDLASIRQPRGLAQTSSSPVPGGSVFTNPAYLHNGAPATLANYEPSQSYPLSLKPVVTPANNPDFYRNERKRKAEASAGPLARKYRNIMLPGTGFSGPNIYVRAQMALQSGLPEEEQYALHHLVKISHERGDKYRFDQFPGLAEALVEKVLQVSGLFYGVEWNVSYDEDTMYQDEETLDGLSGTSDVLQKLKSRVPLIPDDSMQDAQFTSQLNRIMEAGLILRNMCLQYENAQYMVKQPLIRDYLAIVLNIPQHQIIIELQQYALETAEQLLVWCDLGPRDPLYQSLLAQLEGRDRGVTISTLKTVSRIAMNLPGPKRLDLVPTETLQRVQEWLLVEDEELRSACLDFLFQYTSFSDNVENLLRAIDPAALAHQLSRLLLFGAKEQKEPRPTARQRDEDDAQAPVPRLSRGIIENLLKLDEPERSSEWLRMCFLADKESEMTQISLWQAYQLVFAVYNPTHPHLIAGDFIKNVSTTFPGATAQVAGSNKYVIKGIRARKVPVDTGMLVGSKGTDKGTELHKCYWHVTIPTEPTRDPMTGMQSGPRTREIECAEWFKQPDDIFKHILKDHMQLPVKPKPAVETPGTLMELDSKASRPSSAMANHLAPTPGNLPARPADLFDFHAADKTTYRCRWASCRRLSPEFGSLGTGHSRTALFARHIQTHLPEPDLTRSKHNLKPDADRPPIGGERLSLRTMEDEKADAQGVSLSAALVLRNIAKFMPASLSVNANGVGRVVGAVKGMLRGSGHEDEDMMRKVFDEEVRERLFFAMTHGKPIHNYVGSVLRAIARHDGLAG